MTAEVRRSDRCGIVKRDELKIGEVRGEVREELSLEVRWEMM